MNKKIKRKMILIESHSTSTRKIVKLLNLTLVFFFLSFLSLKATDLQNSKVSITKKNVALSLVLDELESKTGYSILIRNNDVNVDEKVSISVENKDVAEILDILFKKKNIKYDVSDKQISIYVPKKEDTVSSVSQQNDGGKTLTGVLLDEKGNPIIGGSVTVVGTNKGAVSDLDGNFSLPNVRDGEVVLVSYIGYVPQKFKYAGQSQLKVILLEDNKLLSEVVVVGYGTQKKVNLTGSVATVTPDEMLKRPVSNTTTALQGLVSGLQIVQGTGMPGQESLTIKLRGASSWGTSSNPLVLIDGIEGSLATLPATDIESVSVLKDAASASIYGSRAANGVILITTKQGRAGKAVVSYSMNMGFQSATAKPEQIWNSVDYMNLFNKSIDRGTQGGVKYSDEMIALYGNSSRDKNLYPDFNWADAVFKTAFQQSYNLGVNGGSDLFTYNTSVGYLKQDGILIGHDYDRYNGLINITSNINSHIKIGVQGNFVYANTRMPRVYNKDFVLMAQVHAPMYGPFLPDGSGRYTDKLQSTSLGGPSSVNRNPFWIAEKTYEKNNNWKGNLQAWIDIYFLKKEKMTLLWNTKVAIQYNDMFKKYYSNDVDTYYWLNDKNGIDLNKPFLPGNPFGAPDKGVQNRDERTLHNTIYSTLSFNWDLDDHNIGAILGFSQEKYNARWLTAVRNEFPVSSMEEIDGMGTNGMSNGGGSREWTMRSGFGRLNYAFKGKYLAEVNFRRDASSYFHKDYRVGFFPSGSLAWRISEEDFVKNNLTWLDNFKLRGSYGILGNNQVGRDNNYYNWQEVYNTTSYAFDNSLNQGVVMNRFSNKEIKWEETKVTDLGVDISVLNGLFSLTADWYNKYTSGILADAKIPASAGLDAPVVNYGEFKNYGLEFDLRHNNKIGEIHYGLNGQISFNRNKVMKYPAPSYGRNVIEEGKPYKDYYLYEYIGVIKDQSYIDNITQWPNGKPQLGDFMIKDQLTVDTNGDGVPDAPDGKINNDDKVRMKGAYPDFIYSFGGNLAWRDIDFSFFFQGVEGQKVWTNFFGKDPFSQGASPHPKFLNAYDPVTNPTSNVPAIYAWGYGPSMIESSYHLNDASYLRLKNIQIGYVLPTKLINKFGIDYLRFYVSGDNLVTFTNYPDLDPERAEDGFHTQYPQLKTISFGLNLKF